MPRKNKILLRNGTTAPSAADFEVAEPAFDKTAGKLYVKNAAGAMVEIGAGSGSGSSVPDPYELGTYPLITISAQPSATSVVVGSSATFTVTATATLPTATISYQWQLSTDSGSTYSNVSGATSSSLSLTNLQTSSSGYRYRCRLAANLSQIFSSSATLTVNTALNQAVLLTSGTSYTVPNGATTMKAWAVGGGNRRPVSGCAGGTAYKTWSVSSGNTITYSVGAGGDLTAGNTTVTFGGVTITGYGAPGNGTAGTYGGGDGGANGGTGTNGDPAYGGAVGGNTATAYRRAMTDVSGLKAALTLAGAKVTEDNTATPAFGSGSYSSKMGLRLNTPGAGGGGLSTGWSAQFGGDGAVVLYFT